MSGGLVLTLCIVLVGCSSTKEEEKDTIKPIQEVQSMTKQTMPSGLEFEILQEGSGESPQQGQQVTVHYTGWLRNDDGSLGDKFDSSIDRGEPFTFPIGAGYVIKGWDEGVMGMKVGEKRRLFIPAELGYGAHGAGHVIPPNASLIFDVELISIA